MLFHIWAQIKASPNVILINILGLLFIGLMSLYSISILQEENSSNAFTKQIIFLGPAIILMFIMTVLSKRFIHKYIYMFYCLIILLVSVPFLGQETAGTYRWINFGFSFSLQPSEIAKWIIVITLARYLSDNKLQIHKFSSNIIPFVIAIVPTIIVLNQPDLGTAFVMMVPVIPMLYWVGAKPYHLFLIIAPLLSILTAFNVIVFTIWSIIVAVIIFRSMDKLWNGVTIFFSNIFLGLMFPILWNFLRPFQKNRILTFFNPEIDPLGAGYHIIQSKTALGSGGLIGKGLGEGTQSQLKFLPVQESDFVVSVIGEELGMISLIIMLLLFASLIVKMINLSYSSLDRFSGLIIIGIGSIFLSHVFINCSMATGMIPVKGLPLPFISYGGSFLFSSFMMVGLVLNFGRTEIE
jgi:rod shape determining protein RodA|tara:strand:+ start:5321 stop:6547 length:1227 start_codon:yes stop_codon:yes gene_type:complete